MASILPAYLIEAGPRRLPGSGIVLDIGFGDGETTVALAREHAMRQVYAIDVHTPGLAALARALRDGGVSNVGIIDADALDVLLFMCGPGQLALVNVSFPDPWPKAGQQHRRLVDASFADLLADKLGSGGSLRFATDWGSYADQVRTVFDGRSDFDACEPWMGRPVTKFERRGRKAGRPIVDLAFVRR